MDIIGGMTDVVARSQRRVQAAAVLLMEMRRRRRLAAALVATAYAVEIAAEHPPDHVHLRDLQAALALMRSLIDSLITPAPVTSRRSEISRRSAVKRASAPGRVKKRSSR